jgi:hypothetical protein
MVSIVELTMIIFHVIGHDLSTCRSYNIFCVFIKYSTCFRLCGVFFKISTVYRVLGLIIMMINLGVELYYFW